MIRYKVVDRPTARSSHTAPKPRGGGIAVISSIAIGSLLLGFCSITLPENIFIVGIFTLLVAFISWIDDYRGLSPLVRLAFQFFCVFITLFNIDAISLVPTTQIPNWIIICGLGLCWVWFVNLYNFMDGIDGITGVQTICITLGIIVLSATGSLPTEMVAPASIVSAATIAFLFFNWPPSQIFLGDVGSVSLGFLIGWMLLELVGSGQWAAAIILPGYYLCDATFTLLRRLLSGEKVWSPHREHFYQRAVQGHLTHSGVIVRLSIINLCLITLATTLAQTYPFLAMVGALSIILVFLFHSSRYFKRRA